MFYCIIVMHYIIVIFYNFIFNIIIFRNSTHYIIMYTFTMIS